MEQAKVYFTNFRCRPGVNQQQKLEKLMLAAGMDKIDFEGKIVAIKLHFGEVGNLAYLRPNYAKTVADFVKARGGKDIIFMCLIAAPEGIEALQKAHPDVDIFIAAKDEKLNENAYIVPGLGDAGDRIFGTK